MAISIIGPKFYCFDDDGKPLAYGKIYTYQTKTNTPKDTFKGEDQLTANTNPIILNGEGYAEVYLNGSYSIVLKDSDDNEIWSQDPVSSNTEKEWVNCNQAVYASPTSFKITGNVVDIFSSERRVRIDNGVSDYSYSTIIESIYSGGETVVNISNPAISTEVKSVCVSIVGVNSIIRTGNITFNTVDDVINRIASGGEPVTLKAGDYINTIDYRSVVRGGGASYLVMDSTQVFDNDITIDSYGNHSIGAGLYAILQTQGDIIADQYGCGGGVDRTGSIEAAHSAAVSKNVGVVFTQGSTYYYSGLGLTGDSFALKSNGQTGRAGHQGTGAEIIITSDAYLYDSPEIITTVFVKGLAITGGKGLFRNTDTSARTSLAHPSIEGCYFKGFTECAVQHNSVNWPFWRVRDCSFDAETYLGSMALALPGLGDNTIIEENSFGSVQIAIKIGAAGVTGSNVYIKNNDMLSGDPSRNSSVLCAGIWIVANDIAMNGGAGVIISDNKFGNERFTPTTDKRILIAKEEPAGEGKSGNSGETFPDLTEGSGYSLGLSVINNNINGGGSVSNGALVYAVTTQVQCIIKDNFFTVTKPRYILEYASAEYSDYISNVTGNMSKLVVGAPISSLSNRPECLGDTQQDQSNNSETSSKSSAIKLLTRFPSQYSTGDVTYESDTDASGGTDATKFTFGTSGSAVLLESNSRDFTENKKMWIEFDAKGTDGLYASFAIALDGVSCYTTVIVGTGKFERYCLGFISPSTTSGTIQVVISSIDTGSELTISRPIVYESIAPNYLGGRKVTKTEFTNGGSTNLVNGLIVNTATADISAHTLNLPDTSLYAEYETIEIVSKYNVTALTVVGVYNSAPSTLEPSTLKYTKIGNVWLLT